LLAVLAAQNDPCGDHTRAWLCEVVDGVTDNGTAADVARAVSPWVTILLIAVAALVTGRVVKRMIRRAVRRWETVGRFATVRRKQRGRISTMTMVALDQRRHQRAETIGAGLSSFAAIIVWGVAAVWMLAVLGVEAATLLTSAGLIGVALAFGAQNLLRDLIAGTFIIFEDQLGVGDVVDLGVASGTVEDVSLRTTRLRDVEGVVWYVPNGVIQRVGNKSQQWARAVVDVPISPSADIDRAQQVIKTTADELAHDAAWRDRILDVPEVWGVESFTLDAVTIRLVVKTAPAEQWRIGRELRTRIKLALDAAGIANAAAGAPDGPASEPPG
jgi:small conductance mechanosensitive channel